MLHAVRIGKRSTRATKKNKYAKCRSCKGDKRQWKEYDYYSSRGYWVSCPKCDGSGKEKLIERIAITYEDGTIFKILKKKCSSLA